MLAILSLGTLLAAQDAKRDVEAIKLAKLQEVHVSPLARQANIFGTVIVELKISPQGKVISATVVRGHQMLRSSALESATYSNFECHDCVEPRTVPITYSYQPRDSEDCCSSWTQPTETGVADDPSGTSIAIVTIKYPQICLCDPAADPVRRRSWKCLRLWKCSR